MTSLIGDPGTDSELEPEPTPDELLLELIDLVTLAFPEPLREMTITFVPSEDGKRPALSDLDGKARPGQPKRPDLGHNDDAVLDAINGLLVDFSEATLRQGGVQVVNGFLHIAEGDDGDRFVELREGAAPGELVMSRRFDRSELRWLFWTAPLFARLNATEDKELAGKRQLDAAVASYQRFDIDMQQGRITFSAPGRPVQLWSFQLLGSWSDETKRFLWGWANEQVPPPLVKRVDEIRLSATGDGLRALSEGHFGCPEPCANRLTRHAAVQMGALGVYRAPFKAAQGAGFMYLALSPI